MVAKSILMYLEKPNQHCSTPHGFVQVHAVILGLGCCLSVLEEHADDSHHGQPAVGKLCWQLLGLLFRIRRSQHLEAVVTRGAGLVVIEATAELDKAEVRSDLGPSGHWNLGNCCKSIGDVGELQAGRWRQETRPQIVQHETKHEETKAAATSNDRLGFAISHRHPALQHAKQGTACQWPLAWCILGEFPQATALHMPSRILQINANNKTLSAWSTNMSPKICRTWTKPRQHLPTSLAASLAIPRTRPLQDNTPD